MSDRWTWSYQHEDGTTAPGPDTVFPTQADAEAFIGQEWSLLLEDGIGFVTLRCNDEVVYGPMGLAAME